MFVVQKVRDAVLNVPALPLAAVLSAALAVTAIRCFGNALEAVVTAGINHPSDFDRHPGRVVCVVAYVVILRCGCATLSGLVNWCYVFETVQWLRSTHSNRLRRIVGVALCLMGAEAVWCHASAATLITQISRLGLPAAWFATLCTASLYTAAAPCAHPRDRIVTTHSTAENGQRFCIVTSSRLHSLLSI